MRQTISARTASTGGFSTGALAVRTGAWAGAQFSQTLGQAEKQAHRAARGRPFARVDFAREGASR
jgi:hypothetical protein